MEQWVPDGVMDVITLKEFSESRYWIRILIISSIVSDQQLEPMLSELNYIVKIPVSSINGLKQKESSSG